MYKAGDTIGKANTFMWIYGTLTTGNRDIFIFAPFNKPIVGNIKLSISSIIVRQNGEYLRLSNSNGWGEINNEIVSLGIRFAATIS